MKRFKLTAVLGLSVVFCCGSGCSMHKKKYGTVLSEPTIEMGAVSGDCGGSSCTGCSKHEFINRHPLLYVPPTVYHKVGHGPIVKTSAAIVVGVPAGIVHEVKNIVMGQPRTKY